MPSLFDELWVFSKAGIPIVDFSKEANVDKTFLGFFISAIQTFTQAASGRDLKAFSIGDKKYSCIHCMDDQIILVSRSPLYVDKKKIGKICGVIGKMFENMFSIDDIQKWNGDISFFNPFQTKLDIYFRMADL